MQLSSGKRGGDTVKIRKVVSNEVDSACLKPSDMSCFVGESPIMKATIAGVNVNCLMDTGSQVALISEGFFREHIQSAECNLIAADNWLTIRAIDGWEVPYLAYFERDIVISGVTVHNWAVLVVREA